MLAELKLKLDGIVLPEDFQRRCRGKAPPATGWFGAFTIYLAEQVKTNDRFHKILVTDLLADLTRLGVETQYIIRALDATVNKMAEQFDRFERKIDIQGLALSEVKNNVATALTTISIVDLAAQRIETKTDKVDEVTQRLEAKVEEASRRIEAKIEAALLQGRPASSIAQADRILQKAIAGALATAKKGAAEGNVQYKAIVGLFDAGRHTDTERLFYAIAVEKGEQSKMAAEEAAFAYRNLGAIAGLSDSMGALDAYQMALKFDPDDWESMIWIGSLQLDRGTITEAEFNFRRVL